MTVFLPMIFFIFVAVSFTLLFCVEVFGRLSGLPVRLTRKIAHVGGALIAYTAPFFLSATEVVFLGLLFALVLFVLRHAYSIPSIHGVERRTFGEIFLPLGTAFTAYFFLPRSIIAYQFGILVMGVCDALAALVGEQFGRYRIKLFLGHKTLEGALVFFLSCLVLIFSFAPHVGWVALILALTLTVFEFFLEYGADNLVLPVVGAFLFQVFI